MAIIKAINRNSTLARILHYILRDDKTRRDLIGALNVDPTRALEEMTSTKRRWHKTSGRLYKHFIQSFEIGSITPEAANQIAWEFVQRVSLFQDFEVVFATHLDRDHIHTHFIVNSVSFRDGRKLRYAAAELDTLKSISDHILREHGLQIDEPDKTENVTAWNLNLYQVLQNAHEGKRQSWVYDTAVVVLNAMESSEDKGSFTGAMNDAGYDVLWRKRDVTFVAPNGRRIRASRLEELFKLSSVLERYGDCEKLQETLKHDLQYAWQEPCADMETYMISETQNEVYMPVIRSATSSAPIRLAVQQVATPEKQDELDTATFILGSAMCQDSTRVAQIVEKHGYHWDAASQVLLTPTGHAYCLTHLDPAVKRHTFIFRQKGQRIYSSYEGADHIVAANMRQATEQLHSNIVTEAPLADVLMHSTKVSYRCEVDINHLGRSRIHLQDGWHNLSDITHDADHPEPTMASREEVCAKQPAPPGTIQLENLLAAVREATYHAETRNAFTNAMQEAGYTLRWTQNGTLTFICPDGERIRSSRLEKRYHLPPIAAAYGSSPRIPTKGERPVAAKTVQDAASRSRTTSEFTEAMQVQGYELQWNLDKTDATIITSGGQHIRLSSLIRQFGLPTGGVLDGVHCEKTSGVSEGGDLGSLRDAANRAKASIDRGRAGLANRRADRADSNPDMRDRELAAEAAVRQRAHRETGRQRPRTAAKSTEQRGSTGSTPSRGGADAERAANAWGSRDDAAER